MTTNSTVWTDALIHLFARLEGEGQYNLAKLARAAADALCRQVAYQVLLEAGCRLGCLHCRSPSVVIIPLLRATQCKSSKTHFCNSIIILTNTIVALKAGENPFDVETLEQLRNEENEAAFRESAKRFTQAKDRVAHSRNALARQSASCVLSHSVRW